MRGAHFLQPRPVALVSGLLQSLGAASPMSQQQQQQQTQSHECCTSKPGLGVAGRRVPAADKDGKPARSSKYRGVTKHRRSGRYCKAFSMGAGGYSALCQISPQPGVRSAAS